MFWGGRPPKKGLLGDVPPEGALAHFEKWGLLGGLCMQRPPNLQW